MKRRKVDSQRERRVLIGLVTSKRFLSQAKKVLTDLELITEEPYRVVAKWCFDYHEEYGKAPGAHVEDLYHKWSEDNDNSDLVSSVKDFLETLGEEYEKAGELNVPYLLDDLRDFVTKRSLVQLKDAMDFALVSGNVKEAQDSVVAYRKIEVGQGSSIDPMRDREAWKRAFSEPEDPLVVFEGDAGRFFNDNLTRDALIGIQAAEKTGKTFWCIEFVMRALRRRKKVALFEVGDLSESQIMRRLGVRWSGLPMRKRDLRRSIVIPHTIEVDEAAEAGYSIEADKKRFRRIMNDHDVQRGMERFSRAFGLSSKRSYIRTAVHPAGTVNVRDISGEIDQWEQEHDFVPDVIVIDYADILAPENPGRKESRDNINETWMALRKLSQDRHALVIVPTQASADTYEHRGEKLQTKRNFSNDKRKLAHCTAMLALNQTPEEKLIQGMRLNWLVVRESDFNEGLPLYVGNCLKLGRALCCAKFSSRMAGSSDND